jgi:hypothetical protein
MTLPPLAVIHVFPFVDLGFTFSEHLKGKRSSCEPSVGKDLRWEVRVSYLLKDA